MDQLRQKLNLGQFEIHDLDKTLLSFQNFKLIINICKLK